MAVPIHYDLLNYSNLRSQTLNRYFVSTNSTSDHFGRTVHHRVDALWRAQPWVPVPVRHPANIHIANDGPWALIDDPAITDDHWTAGNWYEPNSSYDGDLDSPVALTYREHLRRLSIFGNAYHIHLAYVESTQVKGLGRAFITDNDGHLSTDDHLLDDPHGLPAPVYSILTRAALLTPQQAPRPLFPQ